jgi:hypothetical protein
MIRLFAGCSELRHIAGSSAASSIVATGCVSATAETTAVLGLSIAGCAGWDVQLATDNAAVREKAVREKTGRIRK